jgi:CRISPR-associated endonuclease/helicase Cas3
MPFTHVLRRKDLIELFDTTPDLAGADIDIARFIRDRDESDVQVFWRDIPEEGPPPDERSPDRKELCAVPISSELKKKKLWKWDHLEKCWVAAHSVYPGLVLLLASKQGGYSNELGWTGKEKTTTPLELVEAAKPEGNDEDKQSISKTWQTIDQHTDMVLDQLKTLLSICPDLPSSIVDVLIEAAEWHDAGKTHYQFQSALPDHTPGQLWGKSALKMRPYERRGFRHELASALAMLAQGKPDLAVYLAAAHHGRVRLSIRSLPDEARPPEPGRRFARGIWEGDVLPEAKLCTGTIMQETALTLSYMELGEDPETGPSWLERMLKLRDEWGPFRLAYLEAILRVADWRASAVEGSAGKGD